MKILTRKPATQVGKEVQRTSRLSSVTASQELREILQEMKQVEELFNLTLDDCLIESCIYRYNALSAQVSHILREAKSTASQ